ncbi:hypothetical protein LK09_08675 [Microbacterium mangrovi]|uniref:Large extracellular alpha-helical protein n=1 Tax=Microbacterium mangrovi TaxID=1348253 RepID=A0A0B2ABE6_9MICO|nr:DUF5719 family protein [Microbacterium mangrovi]KHK98912.1 hypothetical protein LK09_08675 [Microbacterium mangrovi]
MSTTRSAVNTGVRLGIAVVVVAAVVTGTALAVAAGLPGHRATPVSTTVSPAAESSVLACDGPILALGRDTASAGKVSVATAQKLTSGSVPGTAPTRTTTLASPDVAGAQGPQSLITPPTGRAPAQVGASVSAQLSAADLSGFAASACQPAIAQSWLVGGSAGTGSNDLVLLANPGAVAATVQVTVYGPSGPQIPPGGADVIVPARTQRVIPLAGLALGTASPVVRIVSSGAPVQASIQTSIIRTLVPGGVDQVSAAESAAKALLIPGVRVTGAAGAGSSPLSVLRMLAPNADARATVTVRGPDGRTALTRTVPLTAGQPIEVALEGLKTGTYSVRVTASAAVVAGVWNATGTGAGDDYAWNAAAPSLGTTATVAVPDGAGAVLSVVNSGARTASVTVKPVSGGPSQTLSLPAGGAKDVPVNPGTVYRLIPRAGGQVAAAVSFASAHALAAFPVWAADAASPELTVYP